MTGNHCGDQLNVIGNSAALSSVCHPRLECFCVEVAIEEPALIADLYSEWNSGVDTADPQAR
jgi:hypothetical protein